MFALLKKLFGKPAPEGRCSRFGGVTRLPFAHRRSGVARELDWLRSVHADMTGVEREGKQ